MASRLLTAAAKAAADPATAAGKGGLQKATDRADPADVTIGLVPLPRTALEGSATERLAVLEDIIGKAQDHAELTVRQAQERFNRQAGPALALIQDGELYKPEYDNFVDYVKGRWGYSSTHGYLLVATAKVQKALPEGASANTGHVQVLAPVLRHNGLDAVSEAWAKAEKKNGTPTAATLKAAVEELGYGKPADVVQGEVISRSDQPPVAPSSVGQLENAVALVKRHVTRSLIKKAMEEDPEETRRIAEELAAWASSVVHPATK
ncbi:hypothetical protein QF037_009940 [Streptomyces canus]|uniref:hypothetical protein n=1 Tax=Streptomyces canus TaxID=58343 RepID=UPI002782E8E6|nr:hypothetical protein [Streptomyces canus]MDQ0605507.1 hypothetical protein [Streptomyces canus]